MNKKYRQWLRYILLIGIISIGIVYVFNNWQDFISITLINPKKAGILILLMLISLVLEGLVIKFLAFPLGVNIGIVEGFLLAATTGFYNTLTPFRGGIIARGMYFKSKYKFPYSHFLSMLSGKFIVYYFAAAVLAITGLISRLLRGMQVEFLIIVFFVGILVILAMISLKSKPITLPKIPMVDYGVKVINGWYEIRKDRKTIITLFFISVLQLLAGTIVNLTVFNIFGVEVNFWDMLIIVAINSFHLIVSFTPAGLGIQEAILVFATSIFNISVAKSMVAALTLRVLYTIVVLIIGAIGSGVLFNTLFIEFKEPKELG